MNEQDREPTPSNGAGNTDDANPAPPQVPLIRWPIYRGWWIVLAAAGVLFVIHIVRFWAIPELPSRSISGSWGDILATLSFPISAILAILLAPVIGLLVDRRGPRPIIVFALAAGGLIFVASSQMTDLLHAYSVLFITMSLLGLTAHMAMTKAIVRRFVRNRGKALAVMLFGTSLAASIPLLAFSLWLEIGLFLEANVTSPDSVLDWTNETGAKWRGQAVAGGIFLLATSIALFFVLRRKAEDSSSVVPDAPFLAGAGGGSSEDEAVSPAIAHPPLQPIRSILLSRSFLFLVGALILQPVAFSSLYAASSREMVDLLFSFSLRFIGEVAALTAMVGMAVMFLTGALSDRYNRRYVVAGVIGLQLICAVTFLFSVDQFVGPLLVLATGSGLGIYGAANLALLADSWGEHRLGLLIGIQMSAAAFFSAVWYTVLPFAFTRPLSTAAGSQVQATEILFASILPLAIALIFILLMKRPQPAVGSGVAEAQASEAQVA